MYKNFQVDTPTILTLEIHPSEDKWFCTIHINSSLFYQSMPEVSREHATEVGMGYLNTLSQIEQEGKQSGQSIPNLQRT